MATAIPPTLHNIIGPGLIGVILAAPLFGIYTTQAWSYHNHFPKDPLWMKIMVFFLWTVLAAQYAVDIHAVYIYLVVDFDQPKELTIVHPDFTLYAVFDSIAAVVVQCFFARRIFLLLRNPIGRWISAVTIVALSWLGLVSGIVLDIKGDKLHVFSTWTSLTWLSDLWLGTNVVCDVLITSLMCYILHTSRTGHKKTDRLINKLMAYSIQSGAITSIVEIICLVTATTTGFHFGHIMVIFPLAALYCISFLANLHARQPSAPGVKGDSVISSANFVTLSTMSNTRFGSDNSRTGSGFKNLAHSNSDTLEVDVHVKSETMV